MKEYYRHAGSETPQYFCGYCMKTHTKHSIIGSKHIIFMRK